MGPPRPSVHPSDRPSVCWSATLFGVPSSVISAEIYFAGFCARAYVALEGSLGQTALQVLGVPVHDGTRGPE